MAGLLSRLGHKEFKQTERLYEILGDDVRRNVAIMKRVLVNTILCDYNPKELQKSMTVKIK